MIYIKYIRKDDPSRWSIWKHKKGEKVEHQVIDSDGETCQTTMVLGLTRDKKYNKIKYLTKEEVEREIDLIKLELL